MRISGVSSAWAAVSRDLALRRTIAPSISSPAQGILHKPLAGILSLARGFSAARQPGTFGPARAFPSEGKLGITQPRSGMLEKARCLLPADQAGIRAPEGIIRTARCFSTVPDSRLIHPEAGIIRPESLVIRPLARSLYSMHRQPLQAITQTSCPDPMDSTLSNREDLCTYFLKNPAVVDANKKFYGKLDHKTLMMTVQARNFWASGADLVAINKRRGRCIAQYLVYDNVVAFPVYGTLGLKFPWADDIHGQNPCDFRGYIALKNLFLDVMTRLYGPDVMDWILDDIILWIQSLEHAALSKANEALAVHHAALLSRPERAWLTIKVATLLRSVLSGMPGYEEFIHDVYVALNILGSNLDEKHPFFEEWRRHAIRMGESFGVRWWRPILEAEDELQREKEEKDRENGYWLVGRNRHGILHPYSGNLTKLSPVGRNYTTKDVIDLLHLKTPTYLPEVQSIFMTKECWGFLEVDS